jgi:hypothetical protein
MPSRNDAVAQSPEALEQQIIAIVLTLHLQLESLESAVAELRRRHEERLKIGKRDK